MAILLVIIAVVALLTTAWFMGIFGGTSQHENTTLNVALDWIIYGKYAMLYPAIQRGYYDSVGLTVNFLPGRGSSDNVKRLVGGEVDIAFITGISVVQAAVLGVNLTAVGVYHDKNPVGIYSQKGLNITTPEDLHGKTIYVGIGGDEGMMVPLALQVWNITDANVVAMDFNAKVNGFIAGTIETMSTYSTVMAGVWAKNISSDNIQLDSFGNTFDIYSNLIVVRSDYLASHQQIVEDFVQQTYNGIAWSIAHESESLDIYMVMNPSISPADRPLQMAQFEVGIDLISSATAQQYQYGYMTYAKWKRTADFCSSTHLIDTVLTENQINALFTNGYLPAS